MRKSRFSESQIVEILKAAESGVAVVDLMRKHGISKATFFKWRSKYFEIVLLIRARSAPARSL